MNLSNIQKAREFFKTIKEEDFFLRDFYTENPEEHVKQRPVLAKHTCGTVACICGYIASHLDTENSYTPFVSTAIYFDIPLSHVNKLFDVGDGICTFGEGKLTYDSKINFRADADLKDVWARFEGYLAFVKLHNLTVTAIEEQ